jgi:hypothetical protein
VTGQIMISDCMWNISKVSNGDLVHFVVDGGSFKCNNMVVTPFESSEMKFLSCENTNNISMNCVKLIFRGFENNSTRNHFTFFGGESNFTDSV